METKFRQLDEKINVTTDKINSLSGKIKYHINVIYDIISSDAFAIRLGMHEVFKRLLTDFNDGLKYFNFIKNTTSDDLKILLNIFNSNTYQNPVQLNVADIGRSHFDAIIFSLTQDWRSMIGPLTTTDSNMTRVQDAFFFIDKRQYDKQKEDLKRLIAENQQCVKIFMNCLFELDDLLKKLPREM
ncbi:059L [Cherax quadricarinatus iridovirus]|uniref:Uncharacterized protein n=1 Tax=Shrimp hemocyte iridescent virus TaxID=2039780 RepID=A0A291B0T8_9VIRU|nr:059L [Cherax quadricarinatus iridovirus]YP_010084844.1 hypothetical protein KM509_gp092 [Shrimp hemocyte iridescent virus]UPA43377.1 hypothetical protein 4TH000103 [Iridovirus CN01]ASZ85039.1 059L [Cherax quadricarinatus iridovirus]ATE87101.1 hypothetical protein [Shrimp hemocyte iridescent virus]UPA43453.1 hypothetical protein 3TG000020 [Iridovirus CN01]UPA43647.1 hypothetical protein 1DG000055 [Iridovirus CN01]